MEDGWDKLVNDHLLSTGLFSGIALLLSDTAECIYSHGLGEGIEQDWKSFVDVFTNDRAAETSLFLELEGKPTKFVVFKRTQSSAYATSEGKRHNLVILSIPLGTIACISNAPTPVSRAIMAAERFSAMLKT